MPTATWRNLATQINSDLNSKDYRLTVIHILRDTTYGHRVVLISQYAVRNSGRYWATNNNVVPNIM